MAYHFLAKTDTGQADCKRGSDVAGMFVCVQGGVVRTVVWTLAVAQMVSSGPGMLQEKRILQLLKVLFGVFVWPTCCISPPDVLQAT